MTRLLGIYNSTNKRFRKDGDEFEREALEWMMEVEGPGDIANIVNVTDGRVRAEIRRCNGGLDVLAIFDHGTPKGLPRMRESLGNVKGLAQTIAGVTSKITIILYACSCGKGWWWNKLRWLRKKKNTRRLSMNSADIHPREGYAPVLAAELAKLGVNVCIFAHLTWGHCCRLPHVARVDAKPVASDTSWVVRERLVTPGTPEWKQWKRDMKGPLRFTFWR